MSQWVTYETKPFPQEVYRQNEWNGPGWYFWNPVYEAYGPFPTEDEATKALMEYMRTF